MKAIEQYRKSLDELCKAFVDTYFTYGDWDKADYDTIGNLNIWLWPVNINDYYRNIDNIICALHNKIPEDILFKRYDENLDDFMWNKETTNLYNFWKQNAQLHEIND